MKHTTLQALHTTMEQRGSFLGGVYIICKKITRAGCIE